MKKHYKQELIIQVIKQHEDTVKVGDIYRAMGISASTFYNWRIKCAGLEIKETNLKFIRYNILAMNIWMLHELLKRDELVVNRKTHLSDLHRRSITCADEEA